MAFLHGLEAFTLDVGPRPISVVRSGVIGLIGTAPDADAVAFPLNKPVMIAGNRTEAAKLDTVGAGNGTLPDAIDDIFDQCGAVVVVIRVDEGIDEAATLTNIVGGIDAGTGAYQGVHALLAAESVTGVVPRILCAPGFTGQRPGELANPVVSEMIGIAERLRAMIYADGPDTVDADAITWRGDFGSKRVFVCDPGVKVYVDGAYVNRPASARIAGVRAKLDADGARGFWWSISNNVINGIGGTTRDIDFTLWDQNCRANLLNEAEVATIVRQDGFRIWGNRTCSDDPLWAFEAHVRLDDMILESLLRAHLWAVDRNITKTYAEDVAEGVNNFLRYLARGNNPAISGGKCWFDPEMNTKDTMDAGQAYFNFDYGRYGVAERVTFAAQINNDYTVEAIFG